MLKCHNNRFIIFQGLPQNFNVMRYHSLIADGATFPNCLKITAKNDEAIITHYIEILRQSLKNTFIGMA
jgi:anthranilate/para-aminobenzoate synthase component II